MKRLSGGMGSGQLARSRMLSAGFFALVAGLLLLVIAVASGAGTDVSNSTSPVPSVPKEVGDFLYTFGVILAAIASPLGIAVLLMARGARKQQPREHGLLVLVATALAVAAVSLLLASSLDLSRISFAPEGGGNLNDQDVVDRRAGAEGGERVDGSDPDFRWEVVVGLVALVAIVASLTVLRRCRSERAEMEVNAPAGVLGIVELALDDLLLEPDPRRAVILAFGRFEQMLAARRVARQPHETALEYVGRILREHRLRGPDVERLVDLFQLAKFSPRRIDGTMRDEAIACLRRIRDELKQAA